MTTALERNLISRVNVGDQLTRTAWRYPDREAVVDAERRLTYRELNAEVNRAANALRARGYERGDAVILIAGNCADFLVAYYALAKIGVVSVPVNLLWGAAEVRYVVEHCRPRGAIVEPMFAPLVENAGIDVLQTPLRDLAKDASAAEPEVIVEDRDPVGYMYTSGTTSAPKGVVQSHLSVYVETLTVAVALKVDDDARAALFMPLFHTAALNAVAATYLSRGGTLVLMRAFDPGALLETIERERITYFLGLPMMLRAVMEHPEFERVDLSSLNLVGYAMAPMPETDLRRAIDAFGCDLCLGFGQTEMAPLTTLFAPEDQLTFAGSVGRQIPNVQTAVMDSAGTLLPPGQTGEIVYRSPQTMNEYLHDDDATAEAFRFGWFHSGDIGHVDEHGVLWFEDRSKDVIKTGGENVASLEVERALYDAEPRILECVVVGLPDERWGEAVTAIVTPRPGETLTADDVIDAAKRVLPHFKAPKQVVFADELPRTSTGKVQKNVLREQLGARSGVHA
jgi:acyl-CoA synthetase (AMP-forming)/AMP-acid ligase II